MFQRCFKIFVTCFKSSHVLLGNMCKTCNVDGQTKLYGLNI